MDSRTKDLERVTFGISVMFGIYWTISIFLSRLLSISMELKTGIILVSQYIIGLGAFIFITRNISKEKNKKQKISFKVVLQCFLLQFTALMLNIIISMVTKSSDISTSSYNEVKISPYMLFTLLIFNPIAEEYVFRYLFASKLLKYGERFYILVSAYCFAIAHGVSLGPVHIVNTFVWALIWSFLMVKTGSFPLAIIMHASANLFTGVILASLLEISVEAGSIYLVLAMVLGVIGFILFLKNRKEIVLDGTSGLLDTAVIKEVFTNKGILFYTALTVIAMFLKKAI